MRRVRGFSLIEVMVVVAILGVMAALAAPNLLFEVQKANLQASADTVAAFIVRAQSEAMVSRRCVRVLVSGPRQMTMERLNTFDCDNDPNSASKIDGSASVFLPLATMNLDSTAIELSYDNTNGSQVASECNPAPGGTGPEIRFRPNGRVFSSDAVLNDDDAIVSIRHLQMNAANNINRQQVLVNGHGLICVFKRGIAPPGTAPDFSCP